MNYHSVKKLFFYRKFVGYISTVAALTTLSAIPTHISKINDEMNMIGISTKAHRIPPMPQTLRSVTKKVI